MIFYPAPYARLRKKEEQLYRQQEEKEQKKEQFQAEIAAGSLLEGSLDLACPRAPYRTRTGLKPDFIVKKVRSIQVSLLR